MSYTPPTGDNVVLDIGGSYTPPSGNNVTLNFSDANYKDRSLSIGFLLSKPQITASLTAPPVTHVSAGLVLNAPVIHAGIYAAEPPASEYVVTAHLVLSKPVIAVSAGYDANVSRPVASDSGSAWQRGGVDSTAHGNAWQQAEHYRQHLTAQWAYAGQSVADTAMHWQQGERQRKSWVSSWQQGDSSTFTANEQYEKAVILSAQAEPAWQQAISVTAAHNDKFKDLYRVRAAVECNWQHGKPFTLAWRFGFSIADWINTVQAIVWEQARKPPIGRSKSNPVIPPKPPEYQGSTLLNFACELCCVDPLHIQLNFGNDACPQNHKVIFIMNEVTFKRVSDSVPVEIISATVGIDMDSWCWSFSGEIPKTELAKVKPGGTGPVEVELSINGSLWRFIVESYDESRDFAKTTLAIRGRSVTAYLDAPYAPVRSYTQIDQAWSRALAEAELSRSGEASPFSINWQIIDDLGWNVPANTFNYTSLTPVAAIKAIAESVGGYVNSDPMSKTLHVLPRFKFPAWQVNSQTVDKTVSYDFITHESLKWSETPAYNGIYVSGENTGVTALVRRTGTAGDNQAPMIVNQLVTDEAAARQLGTNELSKGGKQAAVSIDLPLIADIGLLLPSMLVDFELPCTGGTDLEPWRGIVQGVSVSATQAKVIQTVDLLRRYDE